MNSSELVVFICSGIFLTLLLFSFIVYFVVAYKRKQKFYALEKQLLVERYQQTLLQSQLEIQEQTLQHISRELHDNLGQIASLIKINLNTLRLADTAKATEKIENTKDLTRRLIADLKGLSVSLGSDHISRTGFIKALEIETDRLNKTGEFIAKLERGDKEIVIDNDKAIILYRMIQEILNNSIKHSKAKHINLIIHNQENKFILAISDDGIGFNRDELTSTTSAGLQNLQNRAHLINAQLNITSSPGKGTTVTIELPV